MKWLEKTVLQSENIKLIPLEEQHVHDLALAASDGNLWELWYTSVPDDQTISKYVQKAIEENRNDTSLAFAVIHKKTNTVIGTSRYTNATSEHKRLEIGYTWYAETYQKTYVNTECKLLMLQYAFEKLHTIAVEFRTNWYNFQSRNAILRLGAKQDGILRNHQILPDGTLRDTVVFSIIESEWPACKKALKFKIEQIHKRSKMGD